MADKTTGENILWVTDAYKEKGSEYQRDREITAASIKRELKEQVRKHKDRYNNTAKYCLGFKSPNQIVEEYFSKCNICLDS